jgi:predicted ArsR family transcriptional regulator
VDDTLATQIAGISALDDPVRRSLYLYVARQADAVSRDAAAEATGASRENAAFHLDKLVAAGLLEADYRRLGGRTGPGAGRPSKVYRRSKRNLQFALPARRYELAAEVLAQALENRRPKNASAGVAAAAHRAGAALGATARGPAVARSPLGRVTQVLDAQGYEPTEAPRGVVRMRNCPFHEVAQSHPDLVCGMNLAFMEGIIEGTAADGVSATLEPRPGQCCVTLRAVSKPRTKRRSSG